jgi:hypothetical protein
MRASEFITEGRTGTLQPDVIAALPATYAITSLPTQDNYMQYRFGVAIAGAKGREQREQDGVPEFSKESPFRGSEVIVSFDPHIEKWLDDALNQMGMKPSDAKLLSTVKSEESKDITTQSPVKGFKGF